MSASSKVAASAMKHGVFSRLPVALATGLGLCLAAGAALAQTGKPLTIVLPYGPGGATDLLSRAMEPGLREILDRPVIIEHKPGAAGFIAMRQVAQAPGDGSALILGASAQFAVNPHVYKDQPVDAMRDFKPVALVGKTDFVLAVNSSLPVKTLQDLTAMAKAKPGSLSYASSGAGGAIHLAGELYKTMAGLDILHVPYSGSGPTINAVLGGHVQFTFAGAGLLEPQLKAERMRAIASTGSARSAFALNLPTFAESGLKGYESGVWYGLWAPASMSDALVQRMNAAVLKAIANPASRAVWTKLGYEAPTMTVAEFTAFQKAEYERWGAVVRKINLQPENPK
jgi:tripartite-type tricarboxylate transporter receptor subunit TctC